MKRSYSLLLSTMLLMGASDNLSARQLVTLPILQPSITEDAEEATPLTWTTVDLDDSTDSYTVKYNVAYPTDGEETLVSAIRRWINGELTPTTYDADTGKEMKVNPYTGSLDNGREVVSYYVKQKAAQLKADYDELTADSEGGDDGESMQWPASESDVEIKLDCQTDQFLSMTTSSYDYAGGAHGISTFAGVTFSKATGKQLTKVVKANCARQMQALLLKGASEYFSEGGEKVTVGTVKQYLQLEGNVIPLPDVEPYLTEKGVMFTYQQYEIACYAAGMISFCVPYKKIWNYLTPEAKAVLPASYAPQTTTATTTKRTVTKGKRPVRR